MAAVKLDENVPDSVGTMLREAGHDVAFARDEQLAGVPDNRVLAVATDEGRVLCRSIAVSPTSFNIRLTPRPASS